MSLRDLPAVRAEWGQVVRPGPREWTPILRDLALALGDLSGGARLQAEQILARPGFASSSVEQRPPTAHVTCSEHMCFHWSADPAHAPSSADADGDAIPDWVESTRDVFEHVWSVEVDQLGYRPPKPDQVGPGSPDTRLDVYISDLGAEGAYGFCTPDDPNLTNEAYPFWDFSAYCEVDNDFSPTQFQGASGLSALQATAAHEFFHAIQYGYDGKEDLWLIEGSAVWMEDFVYDDVNDHYQYFKFSPLVVPQMPMDYAPVGEGSGYGAFLFWEFLTHYLSSTEEVDPDVIRQVWTRADGSAVGPDLSSVEAVAAVAAARDSNFRSVIADFGFVNIVPEHFYEEGATYLARVGRPPLRQDRVVSSGADRQSGRVVLDHLSHAYISFRRGGRVGSGARMKLTFDLPPRRRGSEATIMVLRSDGRYDYKPIVGLDGRGDGVSRAPFGHDVERVILVLTNASRRFDCWRNTDVSCQGRPLDDGLEFRFKALLTR